MKLLMLAAVVGVGLGRPQADSSAPIPMSELKSFMSYLDGLRKIFANPDNHAKLQEFFQGPEMSDFLFQHLHKQPPMPFPSQLSVDWSDRSFTKQEFEAWYPSLDALFQRLGMEPAVIQEWAMADVDGNGEVASEELWTMLRDGVANRFFPSFMALAFHEVTKSPRAFFNAAKKAEFERGIWAQIAALPKISDGQIKAQADEISKMQGEEAAENFMTDMGMGEPADKPALPVQTKDGKGDVMIKVADSDEKPAIEGEAEEPEEPFIEDDTPIMVTDGTSMPASKVAEDLTLTPVEGAPVPVKMPGGKVVMMAMGNMDADEKPQPMATIETAAGEEAKMPVVSTEDNGDGTSTTTILNDDGATMEITVQKEDQPDADETLNGGVVATPATIQDASKGQAFQATASPADPTSEAAQDACVGEAACKPVIVQAAGTKITMPTDGEDATIIMEVTNEQTGETTKLTDVKADLDEATGMVEVEGKAADGTKLKVEMPAEPKNLDSDDALGAAPQPEGEMIVENASGQPLVTAEIQSIASSKAPNGVRETTLKGNINGTPTKITITSGASTDAEEITNIANIPNTRINGNIVEANPKTDLDDIDMTVSVEGKPAEKATVVAADDKKVTGVLADGTVVAVPTPEADASDEVELKAPSGQQISLPVSSKQTTPDKTAERLVAGNGQAKMTIVVTGTE